MSIVLNDNIKVNAGKPSEAKYLNPNTNVPYTGITQVNTLIPISERHRGLTVLINDLEYWYRDGVTNTDIILKTTSSGGSGERIEHTFNQNGHTFSVGEVVEYSGGTFVKALAVTDRNSEIIGWISNIDGDDFTTVFSGYIDGISGLTLSANTTYYLSSTVAGALTAIIPTDENTINKPILTTLTNNDAIVFQYREFVNMTGITPSNSSGFTEAVNIGSGTGLVYDTSYINNTIGLRTLSGGTNVDISTVGDVILISVSGVTGTTSITANNGLTKSGDNIRLGGTLTGTTLIDTANNNLIFDYGKRFNTGTTTVIRSTVATTEDVNNLVFRNNVSRSVTDGFGDVGLGFNNLNTGATTSGGNIAIGQNNLSAIAPSGTFSASPWFSTFSGDRNIAIGFQGGQSLTTGTHNITVGQRVMRTATAQSYNIFMGFQAAMNMNIAASGENGQSNIAMGNYVMQNITTGLARFNTVIGASGSRYATSLGASNTFLGSQVFGGVTATIGGDNNTAIGASALQAVSWTTNSNSNNTVVGFGSMFNAIEGTNSNTAIGGSSGRYGGGVDNTYVGRAAGWTIRGIGNTSLGFQSGHVSNNNYAAAAGTPYVGSGSTFIGYRSGYAIASSGTSNVIVIGLNYQPTLVNGNTYINANNQLLLAITGNTKLTLNGAGVINYSTNVATSYTNRSLVDKEYVDTEISGVTGQLNKLKIIVVSANTTLNNTHHVVLVDSSTSGITITLPSSINEGQVYHIKDKSGNALTNNIILDGNGKNIDGGSGATINTNYGSLYVIYSEDEDEWFVLGFVN